MKNVKFEGAEIQIGEGLYIIPPFTLGQVRRFTKEIEQLQELKLHSLTDLNLFVPLFYAAFARNYPDISMEQFEEMWDLGDLRQGIFWKFAFAVLAINQVDEAHAEKKSQAVAS